MSLSLTQNPVVTQRAEVVSSDGAANDNFGVSIAIFGNLMLVGARGKTVGGNANQGEVYLFDVSNPASPVQKATLTASDGATGDKFGSSVALNGSVALIGALGKTVNSNAGQGNAYLFDISNPSSPVQKASFSSSDGASGDAFGVSAVLSGNTALIGASSKTISGHATQGNAYIFDVSNPASPVQKASFSSSDGAATDNFGVSVAISGNLALIGAYLKAVGGHSNQGEAYLFDITSLASPVQKATLTSSDGAASDRFGVSVSLAGNMALIGADFKTVGGNSSQGKAYTFDISNPTSPVQRASFTSSDGAASDNFGNIVSTNGSIALIGAFGRSVGANTFQGIAYLFDVTNLASPAQRPELISADGAANDNFGISGVLYGNLAVIGANLKTVLGHSNQGAAYIFSVDSVLGISVFDFISFCQGKGYAVTTNADGTLTLTKGSATWKVFHRGPVGTKTDFNPNGIQIVVYSADNQHAAVADAQVFINNLL